MLFDEGVFPVHVRFNILRMRIRQPPLKASVGLGDLRMSNHVIPEGEVALNSLTSASKCMDLMCSYSICRVLPEVTSPWNAKFSFRLVAEFDESRRICI